MSVKTVLWTGDQKQLCGYGMGRPGEEITLPADVADSFIAQGLADELKPEIKINVDEESE